MKKGLKKVKLSCALGDSLIYVDSIVH